MLDLFKKYKFLELDDESFNLLLKGIDENDYELKINDYIKDEISKNNMVIRKYIRNEMDLSNKNNDVYNLNLFINLFKMVNYELDVDKCIKILKDNKDIYKLMCRLTSNSTGYKLDYIFNDNISNLFFTAFCEIDNIIDNDQFREVNSFNQYLKDISKYEILSIEEQKNIAIEMKNCDEKKKKILRNKLVNSNLRLVVSVALKYRDKTHDILDLIDYGNIGLMKAAENYDPSLNVFPVYAICVIRYSIKNGIQNESKQISLPARFPYFYDKYLQMLPLFEAEYKRTPTAKELVTLLNADMGIVNLILSGTPSTVSLDESISADEELYYSDILEDESAKYEDKVINKVMEEHIKSMLKKCGLTSREFDIVSNRLGLNGVILTFDKLSERHHISRQAAGKLFSESIRRFVRTFNLKENNPSAFYSLLIDRVEVVNKRDRSFYLTDHFNCSQEDIVNAYKMLNKSHREMIERVFGLNLTEKCDKNNLCRVQKREYNNAFLELSKNVLYQVYVKNNNDLTLEEKDGIKDIDKNILKQIDDLSALYGVEKREVLSYIKKYASESNEVNKVKTLQKNPH